MNQSRLRLNGMWSTATTRPSPAIPDGLRNTRGRLFHTLSLRSISGEFCCSRGRPGDEPALYAAQGLVPYRLQ